jgi:hypothetical protein
MRKINWDKVVNFIMGTIAFTLGVFLTYIGFKIMVAVITSIYDVLIK